MSRMFDEMPEGLKMLLAGALFGGISPTDFNRKKEDDFDWENPPVETDKFPTLVPVEAVKKLVEARKLLIEVKDMLMSAPVLAKAEDKNAYARLHCLFFGDEVQNALVNVNTALHTYTDGMCQQVIEAVDEQCRDNHSVPTKQVTKLIEGFIKHKVLENILK